MVKRGVEGLSGWGQDAVGEEGLGQFEELLHQDLPAEAARQTVTLALKDQPGVFDDVVEGVIHSRAPLLFFARSGPVQEWVLSVSHRGDPRFPRLGQCE